jgi:hypothetical protein
MTTTVVVNAALVLGALAVAAVFAFTPRLRSSSAWKATVTPLSSIMGSGFLVCAPLVATEVGVWAPLAMAALLAIAFAIGTAIRFNVLHAETDLGDKDCSEEHTAHRGHHERTGGHWKDEQERRIATWTERLSHVVLAGAYVISATYYLQLLSAFTLDRVGIEGSVWSRSLTTTLLTIITVVGWRWGLGALEQIETYAVSLNLGMIAALIVALFVYDASLAVDGQLALPNLDPDPDSSHALRVMMGLLVVVQGFETSRFLGSEHPAPERARTMRYAQIIAAIVYLSFMTLMLPLLGSSALESDVTAIVRLVSPVAMVLPTLIVVTAVGSQFSASVADDAGCAGLVATFTSADKARRWGYPVIGALAVTLTWLTDVLSVISLASRAFALFYALQCSVTALTAHAKKDVPHRVAYIALGTGLAVLALTVTVFGIPAE